MACTLAPRFAHRLIRRLPVATSARPEESYDSALFRDEMGRGCSWYARQVIAGFENVCTSDVTREECPIACAVRQICFEGAASSRSRNISNVGDRIVRIGPPNAAFLPTICVVEGADPAGDCDLFGSDALSSLPDDYQNGAGAIYSSFSHARRASFRSQRLTLRGAVAPPFWQDNFACTALRHHIDPHCSFAREDWMTRFASEATDESGNTNFTLSFWFRMPRDATNSIVDPQFEIFSSVYPPVTLVSLYTNVVTGLITVFFPSRCRGVSTTGVSAYFESIPRGSDGEFSYFLVSFGAIDANGERKIAVMLNSQIQFVDSIAWCEDTGLDSAPGLAGRAPRPFIEGYTVYGETLLSAIELIPAALTAQAAQLKYYNQVDQYLWRRGPRHRDVDRLHETLSYTTTPVSSTFHLVGPPLISQTRVGRQAQCGTQFGEDHNEHLWREAMNSICTPSHTCPWLNRNDSTQLHACQSTQSPEHHFGRRPTAAGHFEE